MSAFRHAKSALHHSRRRLHQAHHFLSFSLPLYDRWHQHPHHRKIHFTILGHYTAAWLVALALAVYQLTAGGSVLAAPIQYAVTNREAWQQGTGTNLDTDSIPGDIRIAAEGSWQARTWKTPPDTLTLGVAFTEDNDDVYVMRGNGDNAFWKYTPSSNTWTTLADVPSGVYSGSSLATDGNGILYAVVGQNQRTLYRYTVSTNSWSAVSNAPDALAGGSSMIYFDNKLFVLRANNSQDFWSYDPAENEWATLSGPPATIGNGSSLVSDGGSYLYTLRGNNTRTMYRYTLSSNTWDTFSTLYPVNINEVTTATFVSGVMYVQQGTATTTFYSCTISALTCTGNNWATLTAHPGAARYAGVLYHASLNRILVFRGNGTSDHWRYNIATNSYDGPEVFPATIGSGSDLIWDGANTVYALRGNNTNNFYSYSISANTWTTRSTTGLGTLNNETTAIKVGDFIYVARANNSNTVYRYNTTNDAAGWTTVTNLPANAGNGSGFAYPGSGDYIYFMRGNGSTSFYAYSIANNNWTTFDPTDLPIAANIGGRIVSDGTYVYAVVGLGNQTFYRYTYAVGGGTWTALGRVPFSTYYGTDFTFANGKIYALEGFYSNRLFEYSVAGGSWRQLPSIQDETQNGRGAYNGATIEYIGSNSLLATRGASTTEVLSYTIGAQEYRATATYTSQPLDFTFVASWEELTSSLTTPGDSSVSIETRSSNDQIDWSSYQAVAGNTIASPARRYLQVRISLTATTDRSQTPAVASYQVTYRSDETDPEPVTSASCSSQAVSGVSLVSGESYPYAKPHCTWSGASDAGSGIGGYYVYFGTNASATPTNDGFLQTASEYTVQETLSAGTYYLRIQTRDNTGNVSDTFDAFTYVYAGVSPPQSSAKTLSADFGSGTLSNISTSSDQLRLNSKAGFWQQERLSNAPAALGLGGGMVYKSTTNKIYTLRGAGTATFYEYDLTTDTWATLSSTNLGVINQGGGIVNGPGNYIYAMRGNGSGQFYRYDITNDAAGWSDADAEDSPLVFNAGGRLIFDGTRYIYALRGSDDTFYRFDPLTTSDGQWTTLTSVNFGSPDQSANNNAVNGSDLVFDGINTLYAIQGGLYSGGFAKYSISGNSWTPLSSALPVAPNTGAALGWSASDGHLYYAPGSSTNKFFKFDPDSEDWTSAASSPAILSSGASIQPIGARLYVLRGNSTNFYVYDTAKNSWKLPAFGIFGQNFNASSLFTIGSGSDVTRDSSGFVYATRGGYDNDFIRYNPTNGTVTSLKPLPSGVFTGGSLTSDLTNQIIYANSGNNDSTAFFSYSIATDTWTDLTATDPLPAAPGAGSSLAYDGSRYVYYLRAANTTAWYRFDTQGSAGSRWSAALPTTNLAALGTGSDPVIKDGYLYTLRGNNVASNPFYRFNLSSLPGGSWEVLTSPGLTVNTDGFLTDGGNGYLYATPGNNTNTWLRYDITGNSWSTMAAAPAQFNTGADAEALPSGKIFATAGAGTNSWADGLYSYLMQTANTSFEETGQYTSESIDFTSVYEWGNLSIDYEVPSGSTLTVETRSSANTIEWSNWATATGERRIMSVSRYSITSPNNRYLQVRISMTSNEGLVSPIVRSFEVSYYQDTILPSNPSALSEAKSAASSGTDITTNTWYNFPSPHFVWPAAGAENGASDNEGGSGIAGYYVYFGTDQNAVPSTTGTFQTTTSFTSASTLTHGQTYYLRIQARDNAGNTQGAIWNAFTYRLDTVAPSNPNTISVNPVGFTNVDNYTFSVSSGAADATSGVSKYQYRTGGDAADTWFDVSPPTSSSFVLPNIDHPVGQYQSGQNILYFRVVDAAGNASAPITVSYYYGSDAPSAPLNAEVTPETNTTNSFTFQWDTPAAFIGEESRLIYYYSVNAVPTEFNTNSTSAKSAGPGAFASQKGSNRFYVVAKDEAGNINWNNYAEVEFFADTSAPPAPTAVTASDISDKEGQQFRLVVSWVTPSIADQSNFAGYDIYASTSVDGEYQKIATTNGSAYVHTSLEQDARYFYYVQSADKTGNRSVPSSLTSAVATGRFTRPPAIVTEPKVEAKARSAVVTWATSRKASSAVEYGKTEDFGATTGNSPTLQVTSHSVELGSLDPDTRYYYRAVFVDEDGNTGTSEVGSFITAPAPIVSGLETSDISLTGMWVSWDSNVPSYGEIAYGETQSLDQVILEEPFYTINHRVRLTELKSDTTYFIQVRAKDQEGNIFTSDIYTRKTLALPRVSGVTVENVTGVDTPTVKVVFSTNVDASPVIRYQAEGSPERTYTTAEYTTEHSVLLDNLLPTKTYTLRVSARDTYGNSAEQEQHTITTKSDTLPPRVDTISARQRITGEGATAEAQLTVRLSVNEDSTVVVEAAQGAGATSFAILSPEQPASRDHSVVLRLGKPNATYSYRVVVRDLAGNETITETKTIVIGRANKSAFEQILSIFSRSFGWIGR